jgi:hypothetical protein
MVVRAGSVAIAATSAFVGRQSELRAPHDAFSQASGGHSQLVLVEGKADIGKTTLEGAVRPKGARFLAIEGDRATYSVPSSSYQFTAGEVHSSS